MTEINWKKGKTTKKDEIQKSRVKNKKRRGLAIPNQPTESTLENQIPSDLISKPFSPNSPPQQLPPPFLENGIIPTPVDHFESINSSLIDQPTPSPIPQRNFNLSNATEVISLPSTTLVRSPSTVDLESPKPTAAIKHNNNASTSPILPFPYNVAMIIPALLFLGISLYIAYRCMGRVRRDKKNLISSSGLSDIHNHHQGLASETVNTLGQFNTTIEKGRDSIISNSSYRKNQVDIKSSHIRKEKPSSYIALPPIPGVSPLLSSPVRVAFSPKVLSTPEKYPTPPVSLDANEGIPCKKTCTVTRTFSISISDELMVGIGDRVIVYLLFDDGWCLGDNLDIDRHQQQNGEKYSRMGVLPQECLTGLEEDPVSHHHSSTSPNEVKRVSSASSFLKPFFKPERASSLHPNREANLYLELERALGI